MDNIFIAYEYNMIKKFMDYSRTSNFKDNIKMRNKNTISPNLLAYTKTTDPVTNYLIKHKLKVKKRTKKILKLGCLNIPIDFYNPLINDTNYIFEVMENCPLRLLTFLKIELNQYIRSFNIPYSTPLTKYLNQYNFVEVHLDSILKDSDDSKLSYEIFCCENIKVLSLKHNYLRQIPSAIGRLTKLEILILTENLLTAQSIPFSLTFCKKLRELYVDYNQFDSLPGFVSNIAKLKLVFIPGNQNYFRPFFLWYHAGLGLRVDNDTWKNDWIKEELEHRPTILSLADLCIERIFSSGINFFIEDIPESLKYYMSLTYLSYNICNFCNKATHWSKQGGSTVTLTNSDLFEPNISYQHWACSSECIDAIEEPDRKLEFEAMEKYKDLFKSIF